MKYMLADLAFCPSGMAFLYLIELRGSRYNVVGGGLYDAAVQLCSRKVLRWACGLTEQGTLGTTLAGYLFHRNRIVAGASAWRVSLDHVVPGDNRFEDEFSLLFCRTFVVVLALVAEFQTINFGKTPMNGSARLPPTETLPLVLQEPR